MAENKKIGEVGGTPTQNVPQSKKPIGEIGLGKTALCICSNPECDYSYIRPPWDDCTGNKCPKCGAELKRGDQPPKV